VRRLVKCPRTLALIALIVDGSPPQEDPGVVWFAGDDLFTPLERRRGLPIGNLTSQHLANQHLAGLDRLALDALAPGRRQGGYVRYMDDVLCFSADPERLRALRRTLEAHLASLRLVAHPRKTFVQPTAAGVRFVGFDLWPTRVRVATPSLRRARRRLARLALAHRRAACEPGRRARLRAALIAKATAFLAHVAHADAAGLAR
jgi:hypothetical protein